MTQNMVRRIVEPDPGHTGARKKEIMNMANTISSNPARPLLAWRVIDIIIAAVFAVAIGLIFWVWNSVGYAWYTAANAVTPGLGGIATGMWLLGGVVGGHLGAVLVRGLGGPHQQEDVGGGQSQQGGQHGGELVGDRGGEEVAHPGG